MSELGRVIMITGQGNNDNWAANNDNWAGYNNDNWAG